MKGLWRKRFKKMLKDKEVWKTTFEGGWFFGLFVNFVASIIFPKSGFLFTYGLSFGLVFFSLLGMMLWSRVWTSKSIYDKEIEKEDQDILNKQMEEEIKRKEKMEKEKNQHIIRLWNIIQNIKEEDEDILKEIQGVVETIEQVVKSYPLDMKQKHILLQSIPAQVIKIMASYNELNEENQKEVKPKILKAIKNKQERLQSDYIDNFQNHAKREVLMGIEILEKNID